MYATLRCMQVGADRSEVREVVLNATRALVGVAARSLAALNDDVSLAQYRVLALLDERGPLTMGQLAAILDVNPSTITRGCDVLVEKKLISRRAVRDNRRGVSAELAPRGRALVDHVMNRRRALIDQALDRMTSAGHRCLASGLAEFASAAGEMADHAWVLGWSIEPDETDDDGR